MMEAQVAEAKKSSSADLEKLLKGSETWTVAA
jgi:hypothetical protein